MKYLYIPNVLIEPLYQAGVDIGNATHLPQLLNPSTLSSILSPHDVAYYYGINDPALVPLPQPVRDGLEAPFLYANHEIDEFPKALKDEVMAFKISKPSSGYTANASQRLVPSLLGDKHILFTHKDEPDWGNESDFYYLLMSSIRSVKSLSDLKRDQNILIAYLKSIKTTV